MYPTAVVLALLVVACSQKVAAMYNTCSGGDACIDIRECARFGPHFNQPAKWSDSLKIEFRSRVCMRESINGVTVFKVCCPAGKKGIDLLDLEGCGAYSEDRIAFGKDAKLFQFPWMALLRSQGRWVCGGTLINERYILTAAHCTKNVALDYVRVGEFELNREIDCDKRGELCAPAPQDIRVERTISHEDYSNRRKENDIALLRLAAPASLNENVLPICLPVSPAMRTNLATYFVAGWGTMQNDKAANILQYTKLNLMPSDECHRRLLQEDPYVKLYDTQICAIGEQNLSDNCLGDSGGPLKSVSVSARYVQYGVVSFGLKTCGKRSAPGVYTKVENYIDWILDKLVE